MKRRNIGVARALRKNPTTAEHILWQHLRNRGLGVKFRRQVPLGPYIVDFLSYEARLVIELDGSQHGRAAQHSHDQKRDAFFDEQGFSVLRIWNSDVMKDMDACLRMIGTYIKKGG